MIVVDASGCVTIEVYLNYYRCLARDQRVPPSSFIHTHGITPHTSFKVNGKNSPSHQHLLLASTSRTTTSCITTSLHLPARKISRAPRQGTHQAKSAHSAQCPCLLTLHPFAEAKGPERLGKTGASTRRLKHGEFCHMLLARRTPPSSWGRHAPNRLRHQLALQKFVSCYC